MQSYWENGVSCAWAALIGGRIVGSCHRIDYAVDGSRAEDFSDPGAEDVIELNGMRSELLIEKKSR